ncbi:MAG: hypothetical protein ACRDE6_05990, partial [Candidatus Limnocylindria bacterium]
APISRLSGTQFATGWPSAAAGVAAGATLRRRAPSGLAHHGTAGCRTGGRPRLDRVITAPT